MRKSSLAMHSAVFIAASVPLLVGLVGACQPPSKPGASTPEASSVSAVETAPPASSSSGTALPERRADGCWGTKLLGEPRARVEQLAKLCAPGASPAGSIVTLPVGSSGAEWSSPSLRAGTCVRAIAAMNDGVDLTVLDAKGRPLASDRDRAFALAPLRGPACVDAETTVRLRLAPVGAPGVATLGLWVTSP